MVSGWTICWVSAKLKVNHQIDGCHHLNNWGNWAERTNFVIVNSCQFSKLLTWSWSGFYGQRSILTSSVSIKTSNNPICRHDEAMAPHSSTLAQKILWMEKSGGLQSMGSLRVGHNWTTSLSHFTFLHWRRKWQPTPVFLPGESQGWQSLMGCRLWGRTESDTTEAT